jgi:crotonobetainyl-CoA:carnitine CoA-transferase CaiB-like acyl-CoA transferase
LLRDPHLDDVDFFACNFSAETPVRRTLRQAVTVGAVPTAPDLPPPRLGADTEAVLREAGCTEAEIAAVRQRGA